MGTLNHLWLAFIGLGAAILTGLLKDEASAWLPRFTKVLLRLAVARAPAERRDQYREEWEADIAEYPGKLSQILRACSHIRAAGKSRAWGRERAFAYFMAANFFMSLDNLTSGLIFFIDGRRNYMTWPWYVYALDIPIGVYMMRFCYSRIMKYIEKVYTE